MSKQPVPGKPALVFDLLADSYRMYRRYNRPQLWRVRLWVVGVEADGRTSRSETDLIPNKPVRATHMAGLASAHIAQMTRDYTEVSEAGLALYRLDKAGYARLRAGRGVAEVEEIAA